MPTRFGAHLASTANCSSSASMSGRLRLAKYMTKTRRPPSQGWKTFLVNHADGIASMDLFVVPTISFRLLYGLLILQHARRELLWLGVTAHPTAEWIAQQFTEAIRLARCTALCGPGSGPGLRRANSSGAFAPWAFGIGRSRPVRLGRMDMRRGSSAPSDVSASTMSLSLANGICAICCVRTSNITMSVERTCPWTKMRRSHAQSRPWPHRGRRPFWADYIINIGGFEFPTGTGIARPTA